MLTRRPVGVTGGDCKRQDWLQAGCWNSRHYFQETIQQQNVLNYWQLRRLGNNTNGRLQSIDLVWHHPSDRYQLWNDKLDTQQYILLGEKIRTLAYIGVGGSRQLQRMCKYITEAKDVATRATASQELQAWCLACSTCISM